MVAARVKAGGTSLKMRSRAEVLRESSRGDCAHHRHDEAANHHLVCAQRRRNLEHDSTVIVLLASRFEIQISQGNFPRMTRSEIKECRADDRIVPDFLLATVLVDEKSGIGGSRRI